MEEKSDLNLSQILFKPQPNYIETSLISNSGAAIPDIVLKPYSGSGFHANWYRPLTVICGRGWVEILLILKKLCQI